MAEQLQENWLLVIAALLVLALVVWWLLVASRRTRVELERKDDAGAARRNQALIDAPPAASIDAEIPPLTPQGLAGVGEVIAAAAAPVPVDLPTDEDDLLLIKGLGPKLVEHLRTLGVSRFDQIAAWDDAEIDRIDAQLGRFQGRIRRDDWPAQARLLAAGDTAGYEAKFGKL